MEFRLAKKDDYDVIIPLLEGYRLPTKDIQKENFYIIEDFGFLGCVGLEYYGEYCLLRSLAVIEKRKGHGKYILDEVWKEIRSEEVYVLTETAVDFFKANGFVEVAREKVPDEIKGSSEFKETCPESAIVLKKKH